MTFPLCLRALLLSMLVLAAPAMARSEANLPRYAPSVQVRDFANLLTAREADTLQADLQTLAARTGFDVTLLIIAAPRDLGHPGLPDVFLDDVFQHWFPANGPNENKLILQLTTDTRQFHIAAGAGLNLAAQRHIGTQLTAATRPMVNSGQLPRAVQTAVAELSGLLNSERSTPETAPQTGSAPQAILPRYDRQRHVRDFGNIVSNELHLEMRSDFDDLKTQHDVTVIFLTLKWPGQFKFNGNVADLTRAILADWDSSPDGAADVVLVTFDRSRRRFHAAVGADLSRIDADALELALLNATATTLSAGDMDRVFRRALNVLQTAVTAQPGAVDGASTSSAQGLPNYMTALYVRDLSQTLRVRTRELLTERIAQLELYKGLRVHIVLTHGVGDFNYSNWVGFASDLMDHWFPTPETKQNQILIVMDTKNGLFQVRDGAAGATDRAGRIHRQLTTRVRGSLATGHNDAALLVAMSDVLSTLRKAQPDTSQAPAPATATAPAPEEPAPEEPAPVAEPAPVTEPANGFPLSDDAEKWITDLIDDARSALDALPSKLRGVTLTDILLIGTLLALLAAAVRMLWRSDSRDPKSLLVQGAQDGKPRYVSPKLPGRGMSRAANTKRMQSRLSASTGRLSKAKGP